MAPDWQSWKAPRRSTGGASTGGSPAATHGLAAQVSASVPDGVQGAVLRHQLHKLHAVQLEGQRALAVGVELRLPG